MIRVKATGFPQFLAAFNTARAAGIEVTASGGNEMRVPDNTPVEVLRAVAATGAFVGADLGESPPDLTPGDVSKSAPKRRPRKNARSTAAEE